MLELIDNPAECASAQRELMEQLRAALRSRGRHNIGFPGGNEDHEIRSNGRGGLYYAYSAPMDEPRKIPRHWNSFGFFDADARAQSIVVEINVPRDASDRRVGGFFARDPVSGKVFLLHSGAIGGGRSGISQSGFLAAIGDRRTPVADGERVRLGLVIGRLGDAALIGGIKRFVRNVEKFKQAVTAGTAGIGVATELVDDEVFTSEFFGWKRGTRTPVFNYFSYHGMIVDALKDERTPALEDNERIGRDRLVDLFLARRGQRREVYEVKTSAGRQSLYTAIGQLMTHGGQTDVVRWLVVPEREPIPSDCASALRKLDIKIRKYRIEGRAHRARIILL